MESQSDMQKMTYKFAQDTYQNRLLQEQFKAELENWRGFDAMYDARLKAFSLYNVMPQEVEQNVLRCSNCLFCSIANFSSSFNTSTFHTPDAFMYLIRAVSKSFCLLISSFNFSSAVLWHGLRIFSV